MYVQAGFVRRNRYLVLRDAVAKGKTELSGLIGPNKKTEVEYVEEVVKSLFGFKIKSVTTIPLLAMDQPWLAIILYDIFSQSKRLADGSEALEVIERRDLPMVSSELVLAFMLEEYLPKLQIPPEVILSPKDIAIIVQQYMREIEAIDNYAPNVWTQLHQAACHVGFLIREGQTLDQFMKSFINLYMNRVFGPPTHKKVVPEYNPTALFFLEKLKAKVKIAAGMDVFSIYGAGSVDGAYLNVLPYVPSLPIAQGIVHEYKNGNLSSRGPIRLKLSIIDEFKWDLDEQLIGMILRRPGALVPKGQDVAKVVNKLAVSAQIPWMYEGDYKAVLMDAPNVNYVYRGGEFYYEHHSEFRSRTIQTTSDIEFLLDIAMSPSKRRHIVTPPVESLTLDKFTNVILQDGRWLRTPSPNAVIHFKRKTATGLTATHANVDMRPIHGYGNYIAQPALSSRVILNRNIVFTPRTAQVQQLGSILGLDDLELAASVPLLTVSYNAHWTEMATGQAIAIDNIVKVLS